MLSGKQHHISHGDNCNKFYLLTLFDFKSIVDTEHQLTNEQTKLELEKVTYKAFWVSEPQLQNHVCLVYISRALVRVDHRLLLSDSVDDRVSDVTSETGTSDC